jgi:hypothetical protein
LEHFGAVDDKVEKEPLNFEKLDNRLAKRDAHSKAGRFLRLTTPAAWFLA